MAVWTYPRIDPVLLELGPVSVRWYGLAYIAGFLLAWLILKTLDRRWDIGLTPDEVLETVLAAIVGVLVGSRLGWVLVYGGGDYLRDPLRILATWTGGMSFHGGLVGIVLAGVFLSRRFDVPFLRLADAAAVGAPLGFLFGRLANFVNGELWGRASDVPWAMVFPAAGPVPRHPSQLYEAALEGLALFVVMWLLARRRRPDGEMFGWFLILYGCARIFSELFREPDRQLGFLFGPVTMGQLLSVPMVLAGAWLLWRVRTGLRGDAAGGGAQDP